jgi:hypothetical protein
MQYGEDEEPKEVRGSLDCQGAQPLISRRIAFAQPHDLDEGDFADME